ncbi:hypothetical protein BDV96DRAFT_684704 [Lophiotrema nucula]|uniref:Uncharacterized protein n=1 Tax=Lophiotrema nucula TaxID=690887 RepID=A0A6A5ZIL6_9PLEO|nr:hypothetical protein BDV96DRAFT_684704 [Lophiotrema nucula]
MPERMPRGSRESQWRTLFTTFIPNVPDEGIPSPFCDSTDEDIFFDDSDVGPSYQHRLLAHYESHLQDRLHHHIVEWSQKRLHGAKVACNQDLIPPIGNVASGQHLRDAIRTCSDEIRSSIDGGPAPGVTAQNVPQNLDHEPRLVGLSSTFPELENDWNDGLDLSSFPTGADQSDQNWLSNINSSQYFENTSLGQTPFIPASYPVDSASLVETLSWSPHYSSSSAQSIEPGALLKLQDRESSFPQPSQSVPQFKDRYRSEEANRMRAALALEGPPISLDSERICISSSVPAGSEQSLRPLFDIRPNEWDANMEF